MAAAATAAQDTVVHSPVSSHWKVKCYQSHKSDAKSVSDSSKTERCGGDGRKGDGERSGGWSDERAEAAVGSGGKSANVTCDEVKAVAVVVQSVGERRGGGV